MSSTTCAVYGDPSASQPNYWCTGSVTNVCIACMAAHSPRLSLGDGWLHPVNDCHHGSRVQTAMV